MKKTSRIVISLVVAVAIVAIFLTTTASADAPAPTPVQFAAVGGGAQVLDRPFCSHYPYEQVACSITLRVQNNTGRDLTRQITPIFIQRGKIIPLLEYAVHFETDKGYLFSTEEIGKKLIGGKGYMVFIQGVDHIQYPPLYYVPIPAGVSFYSVQVRMNVTAQGGGTIYFLLTNS